MEGVWVGSVLLSLHVGPLEVKRIEGIVRARCSRLCDGEGRVAPSRTGLTDVT